MALYQDGILVSGANTLPKLTQAQYDALPAELKPEYWVCLDKDYDDILAEKSDIGNVESGTTASRAYSVGELVYVSGTLYRVKTAIASGATFTVGTNIEVTNVSNQVNRKIDADQFKNEVVTITTDANGQYQYENLGNGNGINLLSVSSISSQVQITSVRTNGYHTYIFTVAGFDANGDLRKVPNSSVLIDVIYLIR